MSDKIAASEAAIKAACERLQWGESTPSAFVLEWARTLDSFARVEVLRGRVALLNEVAADYECPACQDGSERFREEESGEWAHERPGAPNFLCYVPEEIAGRLFDLQRQIKEAEEGGT